MGILTTEAIILKCSLKKVFLEVSQNPQENTCTWWFSCEFYEISKNFFLTEHLWTTVSGNINIVSQFFVQSNLFHDGLNLKSKYMDTTYLDITYLMLYLSEQNNLLLSFTHGCSNCRFQEPTKLCYYSQ